MKAKEVARHAESILEKQERKTAKELATAIELFLKKQNIYQSCKEENK